MPDNRGYPTFFERFPSKESAEGCRKLKKWYPAATYPTLNKQWDERIAQYERARDLL
jgi:hypothetical protein